MHGVSLQLRQRMEAGSQGAGGGAGVEYGFYFKCWMTFV